MRYRIAHPGRNCCEKCERNRATTQRNNVVMFIVPNRRCAIVLVVCRSRPKRPVFRCYFYCHAYDRNEHVPTLQQCRRRCDATPRSLVFCCPVAWLEKVKRRVSGGCTSLVRSGSLCQRIRHAGRGFTRVCVCVCLLFASLCGTWSAAPSTTFHLVLRLVSGKVKFTLWAFLVWCAYNVLASNPTDFSLSSTFVVTQTKTWVDKQ